MNSDERKCEGSCLSQLVSAATKKIVHPTAAAALKPYLGPGQNNAFWRAFLPVRAERTQNFQQLLLQERLKTGRPQAAASWSSHRHQPQRLAVLVLPDRQQPLHVRGVVRVLLLLLLQLAAGLLALPRCAAVGI